jgi:hypothetical protein
VPETKYAPVSRYWVYEEVTGENETTAEADAKPRPLFSRQIEFPSEIDVPELEVLIPYYKEAMFRKSISVITKSTFIAETGFQMTYPRANSTAKIKCG